MSNKRGLFALSPLVVFVVIYLALSIAAGDFYKIPLTVAFMIASIYAIAISGGVPIAKRMDHFSRGASSGNLMLMLWIFVMAGAFAHSAQQMGCVDATVNLTLSLLPADMLLSGLFVAACIISLSIGTSVGTIVALTPIATGLASSTGTATSMMVAVVVGGAFFGDNLSFISDTTIVATQTQHCRLSDKFRVNLYLAIPAALITLVAYIFLGSGVHSPSNVPEVEYVKFIPYLVVLVTAIFGMNVMAVLTIGLLLTGIIGMLCGDYSLTDWLSAMGTGISNMGELIIITMMAGGLLEIIRINGGIDYIIGKLTSHVSGKRGAELSIAALVSVVNVCTANNTVAILTIGEISKNIGDKYGLDNRKCASILDTFSCCIQGLLPYGAQVLMAAGLSKLNPMEIIPTLYYPMVLGVVALLAILLRYPRKFS
ncbi:MAG: Na+/H+ antiporter NhaC family protein [Prevotella sp.]|nr:Na+/H+ antiporter NhaC family protein [Prevotella sp.]